MNEEYIGSNFDDFLTEEGLLEEVEAVACSQARFGVPDQRIDRIAEFE